VTRMVDHLSDEVLSALLDAQLPSDEERAARAHLDACPACTRRLSELQSVVSLLRSLPELEPARDFALGPRLVAAPSNVIRLERWSRL
jgi:anti-sigma factor RsiW